MSTKQEIKDTEVRLQELERKLEREEDTPENKYVYELHNSLNCIATSHYAYLESIRKKQNVKDGYTGSKKRLEIELETLMGVLRK